MADAEPDPLFAALVAGVDPPNILELLAGRRPEWHRLAACRGQGATAWFPERGDDVRPAKAVCATCTVAAPCGAAAQEFGIWGGTSARERQRARRAA